MAFERLTPTLVGFVISQVIAITQRLNYMLIAKE
jgi:hypothetical protein